MRHTLSTPGYLYAIRKLALHWKEHGHRTLAKMDDRIAALCTLPVEDDSARNDGLVLLTAAEILVDEADSRTAEMRNNDGDIRCALDFETAREFLEQEDDDHA